MNLPLGIDRRGVILEKNWRRINQRKELWSLINRRASSSLCFPFKLIKFENELGHHNILCPLIRLKVGQTRKSHMQQTLKHQLTFPLQITHRTHKDNMNVHFSHVAFKSVRESLSTSKKLSKILNALSPKFW